MSLTSRVTKASNFVFSQQTRKARGIQGPSPQANNSNSFSSYLHAWQNALIQLYKSINTPYQKLMLFPRRLTKSSYLCNEKIVKTYINEAKQPVRFFHEWFSFVPVFIVIIGLTCLFCTEKLSKVCLDLCIVVTLVPCFPKQILAFLVLLSYFHFERSSEFCIVIVSGLKQ